MRPFGPKVEPVYAFTLFESNRLATFLSESDYIA